MSGIFSPPSPRAPAPAPPPPDRSSEEVAAAAAEQRRLYGARAPGRASTSFTGGLGVASNPSYTAAASALGGVGRS